MIRLGSHTWTARRFIAIALIIVAASLAAAIGFIDWRMEGVLRNVERSAMLDEMDALGVIAARDGTQGLRSAFAISSQLGADRALNLLVDAKGAVIAGNVPAWPQEMQEDGVWARFSFANPSGGVTDAEGISMALRDGSRVLVARDWADHRAIHGNSLAAFAATLLFTVGVTLLLGLWIDRLLVARVGDFAHTADAVVAGRLEARVPVANSRDELSHLARTINAMLDRIQFLMTGLRAITDSLAHDLRTPLTRLTAHLENAKETRSDAERQAALQDAHAEAERLRSTFETLIDIARAETGVSRETMEDTDLGALAEDICELFAPSAEEKDLELSLEAPPTPHLANKALVAQAIGNLLDNAIKYTPAGGRIDVAVVAAPGGVDIVVSDTGPGIPVDQREAAIERFNRLAPGAEAPRGSGLGLSIVSAAAHLHGGRLRLEDNGPGLRAVLELRRPS